MPTPPKKPAKRLTSIQEAAEYMSVNPKTIRRRIADGTFTAYRLGPRLLRVDLSQIDAYISGQEMHTA